MGVTPISLGRVSFNQRVYNMLEAMRRSQTGLYGVQNQLSTGLAFLQPSEDPVRAASATQLNHRLERLDRVMLNLSDANALLTEGEAAAQEATDIMNEARRLALEAIGDSTDPDDRATFVNVVNSLLDQLISVGNRKYLNTYLFSGHQSGTPFALSHGGVYYSGDGNRMQTIVDQDLSVDSFTIPGLELFAATSSEVHGVVDLNPAVTDAVRISDLNGATGRGVTLGRIAVITDTTRVEIDLSGAATLGDVVTRLNAELPPGMSAALGPQGLLIAQGGRVTIAEVGGGRTAADLGLVGTFDGALRVGGDLDPRVTLLTELKDLNNGLGFDLTQPFVVRNGPQEVTIHPRDATTVQDLLNMINGSDVGAWARIADDGRRLEIVSRVSGVDLQIEEAGGRSATSLGIRSMHAGTRLADLNHGVGVETVAGNDLRITTASGLNIDVDLDGAQTLQDVINRLNAAGGGALTASFVRTGNGLLITDNTAGPNTLAATALNDSPALRRLGLDVTATANRLEGRDVNLLRADSPFTALLELREGLSGDDRLTLQAAGQRIERVLEEMQRVQGQLASQARLMGERTERAETEQATAQVLLSGVQDVDFTEATVRFQQLQTALQANLLTASKVMNLSLLDFLR